MTVAISTVNSTFALATEFKELCEDILATTAGGTPDLSYVYPVQPVIDCCAALIVFIDALTEETTSPLSPPPATGHRASFGRLNLVMLNAWILRCAPKVNQDGSIDVAEIQDVAQVVAQDGWSLWNGVYRAIKDGAFLDKCADVHFNAARPIREQGGCLGWAITIRAELGGYEP